MHMHICAVAFHVPVDVYTQRETAVFVTVKYFLTHDKQVRLL